MSSHFDNSPPADPDLPGGRKNERTPSPKQLSKTPSWLMLGFALGAIFVLSLPRRPEVVYVPQNAPEEAAVPPLVAAPREAQEAFSALEAVFALWQEYAVWDGDTTQVALWDSEAGQYARFYEVLRAAPPIDSAGDEAEAAAPVAAGTVFYYRSIPMLTRPVLTHGVSASAPLLFTEPDALRKAWLRQRNEETWGAIQDSIRRLAPPRD